MGYTKNYYTLLKMGRNSQVILPSKLDYGMTGSTNTYSLTQQKLLVPSKMEGKTIEQIHQENGAASYPFSQDTSNYFGFATAQNYGSYITSTHTTSDYYGSYTGNSNSYGISYIIRASYKADPIPESINDYDLEGTTATIHDSVDYTLYSTRTSGGNIELSFMNTSEDPLNINQIGIYASFMGNRTEVTPYVPDEIKSYYNNSGASFASLSFLVYRKVLSETLVVPPKSSRSILLGFQLG